MFNFANLRIKDKDMKKLVSALEEAGMNISMTSGKHHIKVVNPNTNKMVFIGSQSLGDFRAGRNMIRDLKKIGFNSDMKI